MKTPSFRFLTASILLLACLPAAAATIRRHRERPFFLFASFAAPHAPMQATEAHLKPFARIEDRLRRTYCAMVL